jgi:hypothetical protein
MSQRVLEVRTINHTLISGFFSTRGWITALRVMSVGKLSQAVTESTRIF